MPPGKSIRLEAECDRSNESHTTPVQFFVYMGVVEAGNLGALDRVYCPLCRQPCDLEPQLSGMDEQEREQYIIDKAQRNRDD